MADPNKPRRHVAVVKKSEGGEAGVLRVKAGRRLTYYLYREIPCDVGGRGWEVWRLTASEPYNCRTGDRASEICCDCIGFEARGLCRHVLALMALHFRGAL
jgi:hypothetical protein